MDKLNCGFHGGGHSNPLQCSCLENPMETGAWWATVHRVTKSWIELKWLHAHIKHIYHTYHSTQRKIFLSCTLTTCMNIWSVKSGDRIRYKYYIPYHFIYMNFKKRFDRMTEIKSVVVYRDKKWLKGSTGEHTGVVEIFYVWSGWLLHRVWIYKNVSNHILTSL